VEAGPSPLIEALVGACLPPSRREDVLGDLCERYRSRLAYLRDAIAIVPGVTASTVYHASSRHVRHVASTLDAGRIRVEGQVARRSQSALRRFAVGATVLASLTASTIPVRRPSVLAILVPGLWLISITLFAAGTWVDAHLAPGATPSGSDPNAGS
jgi:hypothetical protein